ncbi:hypothetical protein SNEBB_003708 [Seison nebaliae]|nr:hypothetical protein SNEBB_003708 [Seison nebaliae]
MSAYSGMSGERSKVNANTNNSNRLQYLDECGVMRHISERTNYKYEKPTKTTSIYGEKKKKKMSGRDSNSISSDLRRKRLMSSVYPPALSNDNGQYPTGQVFRSDSTQQEPAFNDNNNNRRNSPIKLKNCSTECPKSPIAIKTSKKCDNLYSPKITMKQPKMVDQWHEATSTDSASPMQFHQHCVDQMLFAIPKVDKILHPYSQLNSNERQNSYQSSITASSIHCRRQKRMEEKLLKKTYVDEKLRQHHLYPSSSKSTKNQDYHRILINRQQTDMDSQVSSSNRLHRSKDGDRQMKKFYRTLSKRLPNDSSENDVRGKPLTLSTNNLLNVNEEVGCSKKIYMKKCSKLHLIIDRNRSASECPNVKLHRSKKSRQLTKLIVNENERSMNNKENDDANCMNETNEEERDNEKKNDIDYDDNDDDDDVALKELFWYSCLSNSDGNYANSNGKETENNSPRYNVGERCSWNTNRNLFKSHHDRNGTEIDMGHIYSKMKTVKAMRNVGPNITHKDCIIATNNVQFVNPDGSIGQNFNMEQYQLALRQGARRKVRPSSWNLDDNNVYRESPTNRRHESKHHRTSSKGSSTAGYTEKDKRSRSNAGTHGLSHLHKAEAESLLRSLERAANLPVKILSINVKIESKPTTIDERSSAVLKYRTPHFRAAATFKFPPIEAHEIWKVGWIQACTHMEFYNQYGNLGFSSWEFPELLSGEKPMISDSDGKNYPWYGSKTEVVTIKGPQNSSTTHSISMSDNFYPHVTWDVPTSTERVPRLSNIRRDQSFYTWLAAMDVVNGHIVLLKTVRWRMKLEIKIEPSAGRSHGVKASLVSNPIPEQPEVLKKNVKIANCALYPPNANSAQMLIWRPWTGPAEVVVPPKYIVLNGIAKRILGFQ